MHKGEVNGMDQSDDTPGEPGNWDPPSRPEQEGDRQSRLWLDRRGFIGGAAVVLGAAAVEAVGHDGVLYRNASALLASPLLKANATAKPTFSIDVRRREDFVSLRVDGYNLVRSGQRLVLRNRSQSGRLVVTFVPQHLAEQAFDEGAPIPKPGFIHAQLAGPSRLAFIVPKEGVALTIDGLLSWAYLTPALAPAAASQAQIRTAAVASHRLFVRHRRPHRKRAADRSRREANAVASGAGSLYEPTVTETAIELPWHLALSPTTDGRWVNETEPVVRNGATEMWRTQLTTGEGSAGTPGGAVRAVWNYDTVSTGQPTLDFTSFPGAAASFNSSLRADDRWNIVRASADFSLSGRADISARQLLLSARGGSLNAEGSWNVPLPIAEWSHVATEGRDQYVKVVNKGFLFPFGHAVSLVQVTQREFDERGTQTVGYLRQTTHIVASSSVVSHDPAINPAVSYNGRDFPFRSVELKDAATPTLDPIAKFVPTDSNDPEDFTNPPAFVPNVGGQAVTWHFVGTDWSGRTTSFTAQAVFVSYAEAMDGYVSGHVRAQYNNLPATDPLRTTDFGGSTLTFAESFTEGDTDLSAHVMTFGSSTSALLSLNQHESLGIPYFLPTLASNVGGVRTGAQVTVSMPAVAQAAGAPLSGNSLPTLAYYPDFVENGFYSAASIANKGNVFMEALGDATQLPNLTFDPKSAGGVMTPNLQIQGLSRSLGPVGDLANVYGGKFDPGTIFASLDGPNAARILGGVKLSDILDEADLLDPKLPNANAPSPQGLKVTSTRQGEVVTTIVSYSPTLKQTLGPGVPEIISLRDDTTTYPLMFNLAATITTDALNPANSKYAIHGELDNFVVNLVSKNGDDQFISIVFDKFSFDSASGGKPKLGVKVDTVNFDGALQFVTQLAAFMSLDGGGGPNILDLVDSIASDLSLKLPSIDVGILSLSHVAIDTGFKLPFDGGGSEFNFGFATPDNPFQLALGIFGGGGFLNLSLGTFGVKEIAGSFEFGAMAALDIGVASGAVSLTAGFYFKYDVDTTKVDLTKTPPPIPPTTCVLSGFVKLTGHLTVLEIITLSLEFDLTLTYLDPPGSLTGTATLVVSVALGFFHKSVTLTATKTFVNGASTSNAQRSLAVGGNAVTPNTPQSFGDQMQKDDWDTYCQAFGPVS